MEQREINVQLRREIAERDQRYQAAMLSLPQDAADLGRDFLIYVRFERERGG